MSSSATSSTRAGSSPRSSSGISSAPSTFWRPATQCSTTSTCAWTSGTRSSRRVQEGVGRFHPALRHVLPVVRPHHLHDVAVPEALAPSERGLARPRQCALPLGAEVRHHHRLLPADPPGHLPGDQELLLGDGLGRARPARAGDSLMFGLPWDQTRWSLTSLQQRLFKTGGRLLPPARDFVLRVCENHLRPSTESLLSLLKSKRPLRRF